MVVYGPSDMVAVGARQGDGMMATMTSGIATSAVVLCGGMSSRMGRPKALLPWRGQPMVGHVADVLLQVVDEVVVVTSAELGLDAVDFDKRVRLTIDREPRRGPLAGIRDGLAAMRGDRAFVSGTDVPHLAPAFVRALLAFERAVAPEIDGHVQPLAAVYPAGAALVADALLTEERMRPLFLLEALDYKKVAAAALPDVESVRGFNTPQAYLAALAADGQRGVAKVELTGEVADRAGVAMKEIEPGYLRDVLVALGVEVAGLETVTLNDLPVCLEGDFNVPVGPGDCVLVG